MTASIGPTTAALTPAEPIQPHVPKSQITIDLDNLSEYHEIKPEDILIGSCRTTDQTLEPISADKLLELPFSTLEFGHLESDAPISFTFRAAVKVMVLAINQSAKHCRNPADPMPCYRRGDTILPKLVEALIGTTTERPDLVPAPPRYVYPTCSASPGDTLHWQGVVLRMLLDLGHISAYGTEGCDDWVQL